MNEEKPAESRQSEGESTYMNGPTSYSARDFDPSNEEVEAWAEEERRRREAWMRGPTEQEKRAWADRERRRRSRAGYAASFPDADPCEADRLEARYRRDAQLALEGAIVSLWRWPFQLLANASRTGRLWEDEQELRAPRRRVPFYDEEY